MLDPVMIVIKVGECSCALASQLTATNVHTRAAATYTGEDGARAGARRYSVSPASERDPFRAQGDVIVTTLAGLLAVRVAAQQLQRAEQRARKDDDTRARSALLRAQARRQRIKSALHLELECAVVHFAVAPARRHSAGRP